MNRRVRRAFALIAGLGLACAGGTGGVAGRVSGATASDVPLRPSPAALAVAAETGRPVAFDLGAAGVLRLRLRDSGVVTRGTIFTETDSTGRFHGVRRPRISTLAGAAEGDPSSVVRLTVTPRWVEGLVYTRGVWYAVGPDTFDPARALVAPAQLPAAPGVEEARTGFVPAPSSSTTSATADPTPTPTPVPTLTPLPTPTPLLSIPPTPLPTVTPLPTPTVTPSPPTIQPLPPTTLPSPFPASIAATPQAVSAGVLNCRVIRCTVITVKVILDGDSFFRDDHPTDCAARQLALLNAVDGVYSQAATRIHLVAPQVNCRTANDLGGPGSTPGQVLDKLRSAWADGGANRSIVHLSVGFDFGGSNVIGLGFEPGVCSRLQPDGAGGNDIPDVSPVDGIGPVTVNATASPHVVQQTILRRTDFYLRCPYGYSLHQSDPRPGSNYSASLFQETKLTAHEIGHNFNATHAAASGCSDAPPRNGEIMCDTFQEAGPNLFGNVNAARIRSWAEQKAGSITGG